MPTPIDVTYERTFSGTTRRIFELLTDLGTSGDRIWPFASQPFMRSPGPLTPGVTEEWHSGLHAVLQDVEPEKRIVWRIDTEGVDGTHAFEPDGRRPPRHGAPPPAKRRWTTCRAACCGAGSRSSTNARSRGCSTSSRAS